MNRSSHWLPPLNFWQQALRFRYHSIISILYLFYIFVSLTLCCFLLKNEHLNLLYNCNCCNDLPLFIIKWILSFLLVLCAPPSTYLISFAWLDSVIIQNFFFRKTLQVLFSYNLIDPSKMHCVGEEVNVLRGELSFKWVSFRN